MSGRVRAASLGAVVVRAAVALALMGLAALLVNVHEQYRIVEAAATRPVLAVLLGRAVHHAGSDRIFYPSYSSDGLRALRITLQCSSIFVVTPMLAMGAGMALIRRFPLWRVLIAIGAAVICLLGINLGRVVLIAVSTRHWGVDGYALTHRLVGSGIVLVAATVAFMVTFRVVARHSGPTGTQLP